MTAPQYVPSIRHIPCTKKDSKEENLQAMLSVTNDSLAIATEFDMKELTATIGKVHFLPGIPLHRISSLPPPGLLLARFWVAARALFNDQL